MLSETPFQLAVMDAEPSTVTDPTVAVKTAELCPALMLTEAGTVTLELLLDNETLTVLLAVADRLTVQLEVPGAVTVVGEQEIPPSCNAGTRLIDVETVTPFQLALTEAVELDENEPVVATKAPDDCPAGTVTLDGTASNALLLFKETVTVLDAALLRKTVQLLEELAASVEGLQETDVRVAGLDTLSVKLTEPPFNVAVRDAVWSWVTVATLAENDPEEFPEAIVNVAGTVT
ncbi:MAG TPA: hypothetical protein VMT15_00725 [Bryobacteraceae bacterium]|nr:hypothetical protein [Bryobacteraceae bacterium]